MKTTLLVLVLSLFSFFLTAQITISGQILEADGMTSIPYATVSAMSAEGSLLGGSISEDDGSFVLTLASRGRALITISYIGYAPQSQEVQPRS